MKALQGPFRPDMETHCEQAIYMHGAKPADDTKVMIVPNAEDT